MNAGMATGSLIPLDFKSQDAYYTIDWLLNLSHSGQIHPSPHPTKWPYITKLSKQNIKSHLSQLQGQTLLSNTYLSTTKDVKTILILR